MMRSVLAACGVLMVMAGCSGGDDAAPGGSGGNGGGAATGGSAATGGFGTGGFSTGGTGATGGGGGGSAGSGGSAGNGGSSDAGTDAMTDGGSCTSIGIGAFQLVDTEPGGSSLAFGVTGLAAGLEHAVYIEFYGGAGAQSTGTFDLSQPPDDNYSTCTHCILVYEDLGGTPAAFYPVGGVMTVATADTSYVGTSAGTLTDVKLVEVTVKNTVTTPVPGGRCLTLSGSWQHP
ncbi:MAG: hypothetical protein R3B13_29420 [Polyangiaceae bacterium]